MEIETKSSSLSHKLYPFGFRSDARILATRTLAFIMSYVFSTWAFTTVSLTFISRLGDEERDGCALAFSVYSLVGNSILVGINFGCGRLLSQCFGGNEHKMGIIVQRAVIIVFFACLLIWTLMLNARYLLQWMVEDEYILSIMNEFLRLYILVVPFDGLLLIFRTYIASTGRTKILIYMNIIGNVVNVLSHYICIYHLHMNFRAAPISISLAYLSVVITAIAYIRFSSIYEETWHPITRACLQEWSIYFKLALPGVVSIVVEVWSVELSVFFATSLGMTSLSAQVVVQRIVWLLYLIMASLGDAGNILIGEYIGAKKPMQAANAKNVTYTLFIIILMFNISFILATYRWLPYLFNIEPDALSLARYGLLLAAVVGIFDGLNVVQSAIVKACGMQRYTAIFLFIGFYIIGLPSSYIFMYILHMNIFGFWTGMILAEILIDILLFILIWRFDWDTFSKKARNHLRFTTPSMYARIDSSPPVDTPEHIELLACASDEENDENIDEHSAVQIETNKEEEEEEVEEEVRNVTTSDESLFKLIGIKFLFLIPLVCAFIFSYINTIR